MKTTIFAVEAVTGQVVSFEVKSTSRSAGAELPAELRERAGREHAHCWYVDTRDATRPWWVASFGSVERPMLPGQVPEKVHAAGLAWAVEWAARECAREWAEMLGDDAERPDTDDACAYRDWCGKQEGLPAPGDVDLLEAVVGALAGREPTQREHEDFRDALLNELWDRTPTRSVMVRRRVRTAAKADAHTFFDEHGEALNPESTDWDGEAWQMAYASGGDLADLDLTDEEIDAFWPVYQKALVKETQRLAAGGGA